VLYTNSGQVAVSVYSFTNGKIILTVWIYTNRDYMLSINDCVDQD